MKEIVSGHTLEAVNAAISTVFGDDEEKKHFEEKLIAIADLLKRSVRQLLCVCYLDSNQNATGVYLLYGTNEQDAVFAFTIFPYLYQLLQLIIVISTNRLQPFFLL